MANQIIVFSETRKNWIAPQTGVPIRVLTGRLRKRQGDEALIEIGTGYFKQDKKWKAMYFIPAQRRRVMVEYSIGLGGKKNWWLVDMERQ